MCVTCGVNFDGINEKKNHIKNLHPEVFKKDVTLKKRVAEFIASRSGAGPVIDEQSMRNDYNDSESSEQEVPDNEGLSDHETQSDTSDDDPFEDSINDFDRAKDSDFDSIGPKPVVKKVLVSLKKLSQEEIEKYRSKGSGLSETLVLINIFNLDLVKIIFKIYGNLLILFFF